MYHPLPPDRKGVATMKFVIAARRYDRRILRWKGILAITLVFLAIGAPIFFGGAYLLTHTLPSAADIVTFFVFPLILFVGGCVGRAISTPLDQL
jgi:hypothetical protein